jgi:hypothetical protein
MEATILYPKFGAPDSGFFFPSSNSGHHLGFSWRYDDAKEQGKRLGETPFWGYDTTK